MLPGTECDAWSAQAVEQQEGQGLIGGERARLEQLHEQRWLDLRVVFHQDRPPLGVWGQTSRERGKGPTDRRRQSLAHPTPVRRQRSQRGVSELLVSDIMLGEPASQEPAILHTAVTVGKERLEGWLGSRPGKPIRNPGKLCEAIRLGRRRRRSRLGTPVAPLTPRAPTPRSP